MRTPLLAAATLAALSCAAFALHAETPALTGFRAAEVPAQLAREAEAASQVRPDSIRLHLRTLTETPHVAGTPADRRTAEYVRALFESCGWEAQLVEVPVWLNWPVESRLEMLEPVAQALATRESGAAWDKDAFDAAAYDGFHGYGASGDRYETWLEKPQPVIDSLLPNDIKGELGGAGYAVQPVLRSSEKDDGFFLRGQAVGREQAVHTAADVPLSAYSSQGSKAWQKFVGVQTNTDVFFKVMQSVLTDD